MYSNLAKADYEIKDVKLQGLRDKIVSENNLTPLDILKGFHEKSTINLTYQSVLTEQNLKDIKTIEDEYGHFLIDEANKTAQSLYDAEFNKAFEDCKKNCPDITLEKIIQSSVDKDRDLPVDIRNAAFRFGMGLRDVNDTIKKSIKKSAKEYIESYIKENFGDTYVLKDYTHCYSDNFIGLPSHVDVNTNVSINFSEVYQTYKEYSFFKEWFSVEYNPRVELHDSTPKVRFYQDDMVSVITHVPDSVAKKTFDDAVNAVITRNNRIGEIEYLQNLEAQPITINVDSKSGKYQLIDGYKRLLYITDKKLLSYSAPVRIFTDLDDTQFLALLYAANVWKTEDKFHDRGFLFALKTRFGFVIPESAYSDTFHENELSTLQLYDFGESFHKVYKDELMNTLLYHKHLINDISLMYNFVPSLFENYKYDKNMLDEIKFTIIERVGEMRRNDDDGSQKELTKEVITSIFDDDLIKKFCSKKHLSTRTYVSNYFRDKGLYNRIESILKENLC